MNIIRNRPARWASLLASFALATSALAVSAQDAEMPAMAVEVSGLAAGDVVTGNEIVMAVQPVGYEFSASHAGTSPVDGLGHYHVVLDGGLVNMFAAPDARISLQNVTPGPHTLMVVPAMNNHMPVPEGAAVIEFDYQPEAPLPEITAGEAGTPTITIESPASGETVSGEFDLTISTTDFTLSEDLFGKPNLDAFGHWHVFIDGAEGMGTMAGMAGGDTFTVSADALTPGPHTFIAVLVDNLHAPFDPPIATAVELEVAVDDEAALDEVALSLQEWQLEPGDLSLEAGEYTFTGTNDGSLAHALALAGEGIGAATPDAAYSPGASQSFRVILEPGSYEVFCPVPGHKEAGMRASLTVSG
jgi:plastocyanin